MVENPRHWIQSAQNSTDVLTGCQSTFICDVTDCTAESVLLELAGMPTHFLLRERLRTFSGHLWSDPHQTRPPRSQFQAAGRCSIHPRECYVSRSGEMPALLEAGVLPQPRVHVRQCRSGFQSLSVRRTGCCKIFGQQQPQIETRRCASRADETVRHGDPGFPHPTRASLRFSRKWRRRGCIVAGAAVCAVRTKDKLARYEGP